MPTTNGSVKVTLENDFETNGQKIPAGTHELPADVAEDLMRRQRERNAYFRGINEKRTFTHNSGSFGVGSGAE